MRKTPIDLIGPFYTDDSLSWSQQDTVNYIPVRAEVAGTWTPAKLADAPGLRPWLWIGNYEEGTDSAPIRGLHDVEGQLFAVCGQTLYQISNTGVAIPRGSIPGVGRVSMAHNQVAGGHQLTIVNGAGGYVWNTADQTFSIITDEGFPGSKRVDFIDGYMMHAEPFGRFLLHSDLAAATEFNTLDRFEAETQPDRVVSVIVNNQEVWAFGERSIDVFANAGTATGTFQNKGVSVATGCIALHTPNIIDNGVAWLGDDRVVYHARGYSPTRISTRAIDVALSECSLTDIRNAFSVVYSDRGHAIYYLTVPNGPTFGYDFSTGLWHRRASFHPETDISGRWRLSDLVRSNGQWIGGDYQTGKLYVLDWDYMKEGCDELIRERVSPVAHNNGNRFTIDEIELQYEAGGPETECIEFPFQPVGPQIEGEAPDGFPDEAYTFQYTTTAGTAPISRTELVDTTLPAGWEWDEATATISHDDTPIALVTITLNMRVYDENGLYADHSDEFEIVEMVTLLVTGSEKTTNGPVFATATAMDPLVFDGIEQASGANIEGMTANYFGGTWMAVHESGARSATLDLGAWTAGTMDTYPSGPNTFGQVVGGEAGWLAVVPNNAHPPTAFAAETDDFTNVAVDGADSEGDPTTGFQSAPYLIGANDWYILTGPRYFAKATDPAGPFESVWDGFDEVAAGRNPNGACIIGWYDLAEFEGAWYAVIEWHFSSPSKRYQIIRSDNGIEDWSTFDILVDVATGGDNTPAQLCVAGDHLVCYNTDGTLWTSANSWSDPIETGLVGPAGGSEGVIMEGGRRIVYANGRCFCIGATDLLVTFDPDTMEVGDPVTLPIAAAVSISTNFGGMEVV